MLTKKSGFVMRVLTPLIKHGTSGSSPEALDTIALSTIEMAGATESADSVAAAASIPSLRPIGDWSAIFAD